mmetsp:Transcript_20523/g.28873  ORF Transcript_20523/g.28873 Transcript_20523/m.28873 type:complete len:214 (+) Transcript_20523:793-1434(+)|eukprot:CAMPEP_0175095510 /NCGR_PEP_ID=MMETSP0086_2-20121207/4196_1 /TAXON_ID=136419 /ORGANISM="Unknown Unknown, Strain D1" /LENGTH=213 /DNA_ID=CAMNT_0016368767 /DNA_START=59 /DNA_END=700 /DNA_ORIENTATION=-
MSKETKLDGKELVSFYEELHRIRLKAKEEKAKAGQSSVYFGMKGNQPPKNNPQPSRNVARALTPARSTRGRKPIGWVGRWSPDLPDFLVREHFPEPPGITKKPEANYVFAPHGVAYPPTIPEELYDSIYRAESPAYPPIDGLTIAMPSPRRNRKRPSAVLGRSQNCSPPPALRVGKSSPSPGIQEIEEREEGEEGEVEDPISSTRSSPVASVA